MRVILQRVTSASVSVDQNIFGRIEAGLVILLGITHEDTAEDIQYIINKILQLRIFNDENGKMNLSVRDISGECLIISQFTLYASTKKGNRPSYIDAASPDLAIPLYEQFITEFRHYHHAKVATGEFGADMKVSLINDGPVTITLDSKDKK